MSIKEHVPKSRDPHSSGKTQNTLVSSVTGLHICVYIHQLSPVKLMQAEPCFHMKRNKEVPRSSRATSFGVAEVWNISTKLFALRAAAAQSKG